MSACRVGYLMSMFLVLLCSGCGLFGKSESVKDIYIDDYSVNTTTLEFNYHHDSGKRITQLELQQSKVSDELTVRAATSNNGQNEERLRNTREQDIPENQFIGVGKVTANYELQRVALRHIFKVDNNGRFQIDLAPELALSQLDSKYSSGQRHMSLDLNKLGGGVFFNSRWIFNDALSLNFSSDHTFYEGSSSSAAFTLFLRVYPTNRFYIDFGKYVGGYDFGDDTKISYEGRVEEKIPCLNNCVYIYDGTSNSDLEFNTSGYRMAIGIDF